MNSVVNWIGFFNRPGPLKQKKIHGQFVNMESGSKYQRPLDYQIRKLGDPCGIYYGFQTEYLVFRHLTIGKITPINR